MAKRYVAPMSGPGIPGLTALYPPLGSASSTEVKLLFRLPDGSRIACIGEIVYEVFDRGTAIAFTEISQYHRDRIAEFFERQAA
jgi:hypothetical protein